MLSDLIIRRPDRSAVLRTIALAGALAAALLAFLSSGARLRPGPMEPAAFRGGQGYWLLAKDGGVFAFGDARYFGPNRNQGHDIAGMAATPTGNGYWTMDDDGDVFAYGDAADYGSRPGPEIDNVVGFSARPQGDGYWMVSEDGAVYAFGQAAYFGSANTLKLSKPIVGMAATPSGKGYWLIAGDGGVFAYGDAPFFGSTGAIKLKRPIIDFGPSADGKGYRFIGSDGGVFAYGSAGFFGSTGAMTLNQPVVGFTATPSGKGYWLVGKDGGVFSFGDAKFYGSTGSLKLNAEIVAIVATPQVKVPPVAKDDTATVAEDGSVTIDVEGNDTHALPATVSIEASPASGTATVSAGKVLYKPKANFNGKDSFKYKLTDTVGHSATATVTVTVTAVPDAPVAKNASATTSEDTALNGAVSASDADGDSLTYSKVSGPSNGTVTVNANGTFSYTPNANYNGPDTFTFRAKDGTSDSNTATVLITVTPVNDAPPVVVNDSGSTAEDTPLVGSLSATDVDNDAVTFAKVAGPSNGSVTVEANGAFTYTPNGNFNGTDSFTFKANDGIANSNTATFSITVTAVNDAPVATGSSGSTPEDTALSGLVTGSDAEDDLLTFAKVGDPAHGSVTVNTDGTFTYTPASNYSGPDSFTFKANDGTADSNTATVSITVNPVNDAPVAVSQSMTTPLATPVTGSMTATDVEGDTLTYAVVDGPDNGLLVWDSDGSFTYTPFGLLHSSDSFTFVANDGLADSNVATITITVDSPPVAVDDNGTTGVSGSVAVDVLANDSDPDPLETLTVVADVSVTANNGTVVCLLGVCTYTAEAGFHGTDTFTYTLTDTFGASDTATVTITVPED